MSDLPGPICESYRFFGNFGLGGSSKKTDFLTFESEKIFKNNFLLNFVVFPENMILQLHFGIFTSGVLPVDQKRQVFEILSATFSF